MSESTDKLLDLHSPVEHSLLIVNVKNCARCGHDHDKLTFRRFYNVVIDKDGTPWPWWGKCPNTGEPVLLHMTAATELVNR